tara:strand:+ start:1406 stop:2128 length:723 start_codon:yes stop_codon:yes gene_type:complete
MKHYIYGNGQSRIGYGVARMDGVSWGCNAIYRDHEVDNLVAVDYGIQGEIIESGYARRHQCYFSDWNVLPSDINVKEELCKGFKEENIYYYGKDKGQMVVNGSSREKDKVKKELGLHVIYPNEEDMIMPITDPKEWGAGTTAVHLACQDGACREVYMFGFDIANYSNGERINNIYKGSKFYLPKEAEGRNPHDWRQQLYLTFREFSNVKFTWVNNDFKYIEKSRIADCPNVEFKTYDNIR